MGKVARGVCIEIDTFPYFKWVNAPKWEESRVIEVVDDNRVESCNASRDNRILLEDIIRYTRAKMARN
jgi:hypothetical protein